MVSKIFISSIAIASGLKAVTAVVPPIDYVDPPAPLFMPAPVISGIEPPLAHIEPSYSNSFTDPVVLHDESSIAPVSEEVPILLTEQLPVQLSNEAVSTPAQTKEREEEKKKEASVVTPDLPKVEELKSSEKPQQHPQECKNEKNIITNKHDLTHLQHICTDVKGSIVLNNYRDAIVDLGSLQTIGGDLIVHNTSSVVRINAPRLRSIGGNFELLELTSLTSVYMPSLVEVDTLNWQILPILSTVGLDAGVQNINNIIISDTSLVGFSGFEKVNAVNNLNINNNRFMDIVSSNVQSVSGYLQIASNAKSMKVELPELKSANNVTIRDTSSINMSKIETVLTSFELIDNGATVVKFPKLKSVGETLGLIENSYLKDAEFPVLKQVDGGLLVINNTQLAKINGFPKLQQIGGAIEFSGDFKAADFPQLRLVKGSALIKSQADSLDCSTWIKPDRGQSVIRGGSVVCTSGRRQSTVSMNDKGQVVSEDFAVLPDNSNKSQAFNSAGSKYDKFVVTLCLAFAIVLDTIF